MERTPRRAREITVRRLEDLLRNLSKRFGPLTGKVSLEASPGISLRDIGGIRRTKREVESLIFSLRQPELHTRWSSRRSAMDSICKIGGDAVPQREGAGAVCILRGGA